MDSAKTSRHFTLILTRLFKNKYMFNNLKKAFNNFISNPIYVLVFYLIVNLLPSFGLVFTEPFNIVGKIVLITFPLGLYLLFFTLAKNTGLMQLLLFPLIFLHSFQLVIFYLFGEGVVAADMFLNVVTTNPSEAGELLSSIWPAVVFVILVYIPTIIIAVLGCKRKIILPSYYRYRIFFLGLSIFVLTYVLSFFAQNRNADNFAYNQDLYPYNVIYNLDFAINKWQRSNKYEETSKNFTFNANRDSTAQQREIYAIVVGETSRADSWSLYGYNRQTNPLLSNESGIVVFRDALTQSNTTHKSVSIILSAASAQNYDIIYRQKSIVEAFKEVGFTTVFLSNQAPNHTFTEFFAKEADYYINLRAVDKEGIITRNSLDEELLKEVKYYVDSIPGNLFFVLHTYGSHFNYSDRYPRKFSVFKPDNVTEITYRDHDKLINAYDNTILYTDYLLSSLAEILKQSDACSAFYYSSDHGEDIMDDKRMRFLHASPNPTYYQLRIPTLLWFSDRYKNTYKEKYMNALLNKDKPVSTNAAFHTVLEMANISTSFLNKDLSLVGKDFKIAKRMYLNDHDKPVFFYNANLKEEDKRMIEKNHIYH